MPEQWVTFLQTDELAAGNREVFDTDLGSILLLNIDEHYYAVENLCSHEEYELADGIVDGCNLECRKHGSFFDVRTGEALNAPATRPIKVYPVRVENGNIQVKLDLGD